MINVHAFPRLLTLVIFVIFTMQLEDCSKKSSNKESSVTTIPDSLKRYPFRSAIIELHYGGSASGKQMIYIDDFGQREMSFDSLTMKMMDMDMPNYKMQIRKGDTLYQIDFVRGTATEGVSHVNEADERDMSAFGEAMARGMGMKKDSVEQVVAGQNCTVWSSDQMGTKTWTWNNIILKSEATVGGDTIHLEATSVDIDVPVPPERFDPPGGIHYTTAEEMQSMLDQLDKKHVGGPARRKQPK